MKKVTFLQLEPNSKDAHIRVQFNIPREKVLILTKCFGLVGENPRTKNQSINHLADTRDYVNKSGLSRTAIFRAVDASLERLQTPYIDLLQIHRFDFNTPLEETMKALHDLVESGKVRYIGASSMRAWQFAELQNTAEKHNWTKFVSMQNEYSLLYREEVSLSCSCHEANLLKSIPQEREMIPYCNAHGIGLIPWGPLQAGTLARPLGQQTVRSESSDRKFSDADETIIKRVEEIAQKRGCTMAQVALAWIDGKVASPIVGFSSVCVALLVRALGICSDFSMRRYLACTVGRGYHYWSETHRGRV